MTLPGQTPKGPVSLGMQLRTDVECPRCGHTQGRVTHNGEGTEVLQCAECGKFWESGGPSIPVPKP